MEACSVARATEAAAERALQRAVVMERRRAQYGAYCLTTREYHAVYLDMFYRAPDASGAARVGNVQERIAAALGMSQSGVSRLLARADMALEFLADRGVWAGWRVDTFGCYTFDAPCAERPPALPVFKPFVWTAASEAVARRKSKVAKWGAA